MKTRKSLITASAPGLVLGLVIIMASISRAELAAPHNAANNIGCANYCHILPAVKSPYWDHVPADIDDTPTNHLCNSCHTAVSGPFSMLNAPAVLTHSSISIDNSYGDWTTECTDCHSPHFQEQLEWYNNGETGMFLATGQITGYFYDGGTGESTLNYDTAISYSGSWDATRLTKKSSDYRRTILLPNIASLVPDTTNDPSYPVIAVDEGANTITVKGDISESLNTTPLPSSFGIIYGQLIRKQIKRGGFLENVKFFDNTGSGNGGFTDQSGMVFPKGICQVCHTRTAHWSPTALTAGDNHYPTRSCTECHSHADGFAHGGPGGGGCDTCHGHDAGYEYSPGKYSQGTGTTYSHSTHTENDVDDLKGPNLACSACHDITNFPYFASGTDSSGDGRISLSETDVCDTCHSPLGTYDGVDDATVGAKTIWAGGAYDHAGGNPHTLQSGKEKWCATCHDEVASVVSGITAPNVVGDESGITAYGTGWGYYKTGHGLDKGNYPASEGPAANVQCSGCHDYSINHIDGEHRTYTVAGDNYQAGYRLKLAMDIPRSDAGEPVSDFALCFSCHDPDPFLNSGSTATNFMEGTTNSHYRHLQSPACCSSWAGTDRWDSDWDGVSGDSKISCPACHNVHGSPSPRMFRHGELISTPGTMDKVDKSLGFEYQPTGTYPTLLASTGGTMTRAGGGNIDVNGVCSMCHSSGHGYTRTPGDLYPPTISKIYGRSGSPALTVIFSEAVYTNTGASGSLVAGDFTFTDLDNNRTITGVTHSAGEDIATITLSTALDPTNDLNIDTLAAATGGSIFDANDIAMGTSTTVVGNDGTPPVAAGLNPANNATAVNEYATLSVTLSDSDVGIDFTTFSMTLSGNKGYNRVYDDTSPEVSKSGTRDSYIITVDPDPDFSQNEIITVSVAVDDLVGNSLTAPSWSFTTNAAALPRTLVLRPSGMASGSYTAVGGGWDTILDTNDGDISYAHICCTSAGAKLYMDMDDPVVSMSTVQSITFHVRARYNEVGGANPPGSTGDLDIGYSTDGGATTVWKGSTATTHSDKTYDLISSITYNTDSTGGGLDLADITNLQIATSRLVGSRLMVTEIYVEVTYLP